MPLTTTIGGTASDSYVTLGELVAYVTATGQTLPAGTDTEREAVLRRAALALEDRYSFRGYPTYETQARAWPRADVGAVNGWAVKNTIIPEPIKRAQMELAIAMLGGLDLFPIRERQIVEEASSVGPLSESVKYLAASTRPSVPSADRAVLPYLASGGGIVQLVRA